MFPFNAYRGWIEFDVVDPDGTRHDGRFVIAPRWTVLTQSLSGKAASVELVGPTQNDRLGVATARALDVLQRVGPIEGRPDWPGYPDRRLGYVGIVGCILCWDEHGLVTGGAREVEPARAEAIALILGSVKS